MTVRHNGVSYWFLVTGFAIAGMLSDGWLCILCCVLAGLSLFIGIVERIED